MAGLAAVAAVAVVALTGGVASVFEESGVAAPVDLAWMRPAPATNAGAGAPVRAAPAPAPVAAAPEWRIQVGAFTSAGAAEAHVRALSRRVPEMVELRPEPEAAGRLTRARLGGFADRAAAEALCARIRIAGSGCFPVAPAS